MIIRKVVLLSCIILSTIYLSGCSKENNTNAMDQTGISSKFEMQSTNKSSDTSNAILLESDDTHHHLFHPKDRKIFATCTGTNFSLAQNQIYQNDSFQIEPIHMEDRAYIPAPDGCFVTKDGTWYCIPPHDRSDTFSLEYKGKIDLEQYNDIATLNKKEFETPNRKNDLTKESIFFYMEKWEL